MVQDLLGPEISEDAIEAICIDLVHDGQLGRGRAACSSPGEELIVRSWEGSVFLGAKRYILSEVCKLNSSAWIFIQTMSTRQATPASS